MIARKRAAEEAAAEAASKRPKEGATGSRTEERNYEREVPYTRTAKLGEGTYGIVYKAFHKVTKKPVALKKVALDTAGEGVPGTTVREVAILKDLQHPNIISLNDVMCVGSRLYVVFELMEFDLSDYFKEQNRTPFPLHIVKSLTWQLCLGAKYLHGRNIIHRDLKPQNLLLNRRSGELKIADFGLSRRFSLPHKPYTPEVVTLWYRCPELMLGDKCYTPGLDMWSIGCILAEMSRGTVLASGDSEIHQLFLIFKALGTPTEETWPGFSQLPFHQETFPKWAPADLQTAFPLLPKDGVDLVFDLLRYDKERRLTAQNAVSSTFLTNIQGRVPLLAPTTDVALRNEILRRQAKTPKTPWHL